MHVSFSPEEIIQIVGPIGLRGSTSERVRGIAAINAAETGDLTFLGSPKYKSQVGGSRASVVLLPEDFEGDPAPGQLFLLVKNPSAALATLCARIEHSLWPKPEAGIHPSAVVAPTARVAASATVGPLCVIESGVIVGERVHLQAHVFLGRGVRVGDDCWFQAGVRITADCEIHERVRLQPGVVIGSDGFGYEFTGGRHEKVPQVGCVIIEADVEIGANSTVDRARFSRTVIGLGTKIDNLVQVGHNVIIGKHCILCAQVGIAGSTSLGDYVILGGQVGVSGHLTVGRGVKAGGRAGIVTDLEAGMFVLGMPALPHILEQRINVLRKRLPDLFKRVDALETLLVELKKSSAG